MVGAPSSSVDINRVFGADADRGGGKRSDTGPLIFMKLRARCTRELNKFGTPFPIRPGVDTANGTDGGATPVTFDGAVAEVSIVLEHNYFFNKNDQ